MVRRLRQARIRRPGFLHAVSIAKFIQCQDIPKYLGRDWSGTSVLMRRRAPDEIPAAPTPVITRPTIRAADVGAVADTMEPNSNIATSPRSTGINVNNVSQADCHPHPYPTWLSNMSSALISVLVDFLSFSSLCDSRRRGRTRAEACTEAIRSLLRTMLYLQNYETRP